MKYGCKCKKRKPVRQDFAFLKNRSNPSKGTQYYAYKLVCDSCKKLIGWFEARKVEGYDYG